MLNDVLAYLVIVLVVLLIYVVSAALARKTPDRRWVRRVQSVAEFEASRAVAATDPGRALELAWTAYERTQAWGGPSAAYGQAVLGERLAQMGRWEDALTHLLPAIAGLRGVRRAEDALASTLLDASWTHDALDDPAAALPLVEEALNLMVRHGHRRRHVQEYHRALRSRAGLLRRLGRLDEAIRAGQEAIMVARSVDPEGMTTTALLLSMATVLQQAGRPEESIEYAEAVLTRLRGRPGVLDDPWPGQHLGYAASALGAAKAELGAYGEAADAYAEALSVFEHLAELLPDRYALMAVDARIEWARALVGAGSAIEAEAACERVPDLVTDVARAWTAADKQEALGKLYAVRAEIRAAQGRTDEARSFAATAEQHLLRAESERPHITATALAAVRAFQQRLATV